MGWKAAAGVLALCGAALILLSLSINYTCMGGPGLPPCAPTSAVAYASVIFVAGVVALAASGALLLWKRLRLPRGHA